MIKFAVVFAIVIIVALLAYIRLSPSDPARWHKTFYTDALGAYSAKGGFSIIRPVDAPDMMARLHEIALATPRTHVLSGDIARGHVTYITRSRVFGFPDYTNIYLTGKNIALSGRLRFGLDDFGVNKARILGWLEALAPAPRQG